MDENGKLCLFCCRGFQREIAAAIDAEGWKDVTVAGFPTRCGHPPLSWKELQAGLDDDCTDIVVLGAACLSELGDPPVAWPPTRLLFLEQCFHLVAGAALVEEALARGAYLVTPAWLEHWPQRIAELGFSPETVAEFFKEFAKELLLLDTGIVPEVNRYLAEFAEVVTLPANRIPVGIDHTKLFLNSIVSQWRLDRLQQVEERLENRHAQDRADHLMAIDCLSRLGKIMTEMEAISAIEELFFLLFSPKEIYYLRVENGVLDSEQRIPSGLLTQMRSLNSDYAWTESGRGFLLRIHRNGELLGLVVAEELAFPDYRERYLNLALVIAEVCGLSIENARAYQRTKAVEAALQEKEERLSLATLLNGVGIWDWNLRTWELIWDDSLYALYHLRRSDFASAEAAWRAALHPDDRKRALREFVTALSIENPFSMEFRIRWPDGEVRYIKAVAEVFRDEKGKPIRMLGANIDITERKHLQLELEQQAHIDFLTGVSNRRYFMEQAEFELNRAKRYHNRLSVFMMDIDWFKKINDSYGHKIGDVVLKKLAEVCAETLREVDIVGRIGGEEFAIMLPQIDTEKAVPVAERLRVAIANTQIRLDNGSPLQFTVSIGLSSLNSKDDDIDTLLHQADQALYQAKELGRNRVCSFR
ncbi:MAG: diguanylate cyclase [Gammaproteobacteria bacterium]